MPKHVCPHCPVTTRSWATLVRHLQAHRARDAARTPDPDPEWGGHDVECPHCGGCGRVPVGADEFGNADTVGCPVCREAGEVNAADAARYAAEEVDV